MEKGMGIEMVRKLKKEKQQTSKRQQTKISTTNNLEIASVLLESVLNSVSVGKCQFRCWVKEVRALISM